MTHTCTYISNMNLHPIKPHKTNRLKFAVAISFLCFCFLWFFEDLEVIWFDFLDFYFIILVLTLTLNKCYIICDVTVISERISYTVKLISFVPKLGAMPLVFLFSFPRFNTGRKFICNEIAKNIPYHDVIHLI